MRTDTVQVALRPRAGLEAVDLGLAMARAWWKPLATAWLVLVVPLALLLVLALREHPWWAIGLLWWLPANVILSGIYETTLTSGLVDGAWHIVEGAAGGVVIGLLHARGAGATA